MQVREHVVVGFAADSVALCKLLRLASGYDYLNVRSECGVVFVKSNRAIDRLLVSVSLAVSAIVCSQLSLRAETTQPIPATSTLQMTATPVRLTAPTTPLNADQTVSLSHDVLTAPATTTALASTLAPAAQSPQRSPDQLEPGQASGSQVDRLQASTQTSAINASTTASAIPVPGTVATSVEALDSEAMSPTTAELQALAQPEPTAIAQIPPIEPGRATRSGSSYVGLGINVGAIGRTPLGDTSAAILSKIGLTRNISVRPTILINGDATLLLPITLDFPFERAGRVSFAPYVGVGASFSTGDRKNADLIVSGGVDIPLSSQFTLTAGANAGLINGVELGVLVGIGYNFSGF